MTLSVLALTGGGLTAVVVEEMVTEAHEGDTSRLGPIFLTAGVAVFAAISVYLRDTLRTWTHCSRREKGTPRRIFREPMLLIRSSLGSRSSSASCRHAWRRIFARRP